MVKDPVCGMAVDEVDAAFVSEIAGRTWYFCAAGCQQVLESDPRPYLIPEADRTAAGASEAEPEPFGEGMAVRTAELVVSGLQDWTERQRLLETLSDVPGVEGLSIAIDRVRITYNPQLSSPGLIQGEIERLGYPIVRPEKRRGPFRRLIDRLAESNTRTFGNGTLDCCSLNRDKGQG